MAKFLATVFLGEWYCSLEHRVIVKSNSCLLLEIG